MKQLKTLDCADIGLLLEGVRRPTVIVDADLSVHLANRLFYDEFGTEIKCLRNALATACDAENVKMISSSVSECHLKKNRLKFRVKTLRAEKREIEAVPFASSAEGPLTMLQFAVPGYWAKMEGLLPAIFNSIPVGILIFQLETIGDPTTLRMVGHNSISAHIPGRSSGGVVGQEIFDFPLDPLTARRIHDVAVTGTSEDLGEIANESESLPRSVFLGKAFALPDLCVGVVLQNVTHRVQAETDLKLVQEKLQLAHEEERLRIAREIHDEIGQMLTAVKMEIALLKGSISGDQLDRLFGVMDHSIESVRKVTSELRPLILDDLGLIPAIEYYLEEFQKRSGIACRFKADTKAVQVDTGTSIGVFRIFQEAMTNVARHSMAKSFSVFLTVTGEKLRLVLEDDGKGYSEKPRSLGLQPRALGIVGMQERVRLLGGTFSIEGNKETGTRIIAELPLKKRGISNG